MDVSFYTSWQYSRVHSYDLPTSSAIKGMHGAACGHQCFIPEKTAPILMETQNRGHTKHRREENAR